ncbi:MAG: hypothetical protein ACLGHQ_11670 [Acidimicrobiia bacterium]
MQRPVIVLASFAVLAAGCGGGDDGGALDPTDVEVGAPAVPDVDAGADDEATEDAPDAPAGVASGAEVPIARFAGHGAVPNTITPLCGLGELQNGGDLFRFTLPDGWSWKGTSGGSGSDEIEVLDPDGTSFLVTEAKSADEKGFLTGWEVVGPTGVDLDLDGTAYPMSEVRIDGAVAYAIVDLPYLGPLPMLQDGLQLGTLVVSSSTDGRPTVEEAVAILETARVERCAAISEAIIWASAGAFAPVPRFEPDPLGKTWPDQPQPSLTGVLRLDTYTVEQLAYLIPVEEDRARCAAEVLAAAFADDPLGYLKALVPSGTFRDEFDALIADC